MSKEEIVIFKSCNILRRNEDYNPDDETAGVCRFPQSNHSQNICSGNIRSINDIFNKELKVLFILNFVIFPDLKRSKQIFSVLNSQQPTKLFHTLFISSPELVFSGRPAPLTRTQLSVSNCSSKLTL